MVAFLPFLEGSFIVGFFYYGLSFFFWSPDGLPYGFGLISSSGYLKISSGLVYYYYYYFLSVSPILGYKAYKSFNLF